MTSSNTRNPGTPRDLDWVMGAHVNKSAVEQRISLTHGKMISENKVFNPRLGKLVAETWREAPRPIAKIHARQNSE